MPRPSAPRPQLTRLEDRVNPGTGTFDATAGTFNFCVSIRFDATDAEIAVMKQAFQIGSDVIADATDGQHRFGRITFMDNSAGGDVADFWVHKVADTTAGWPDAPIDGYGRRGRHSNLYMYTADPAYGTDMYGGNGAGAGYTVAHEFGHLAYGIYDEYSGPAGAAENAPPTAEAAGLSYSLMDNYFTRGGRGPSGDGSTYTLNEFSVPSNHDPDNDTFQTSINKKSDWEQVAGSRFPATAPAAGQLPVDAAPASVPVTFGIGFGNLVVSEVIDNSGSMSGDRIAFARVGASLFTFFLGDTDKLAVARFDDTAQVIHPMAQATAANTAAARSAINALTADGSTNIGGGLLAGLGEITGLAEHSCNNLIVLLTDGDHNTGTDPLSVIPQLQAEGVAVLAVGLGGGISTGGQGILQQIATATGGQYVQVADAFDLVGLFFKLAVDSIGGSIVGGAPPTSLAAGGGTSDTVYVEAGAKTATFTVARADPTATVNFRVTSPSGQVLTNTSAGVRVVNDTNLTSFVVTSPEVGDWTMVADGASAATDVQLLAAVEAPGTELLLSVDSKTVTAPAPVTVQATLQYGGVNVVGATISGTVRRPDGTDVPITLFDDGLAAHGDTIPGDGVYSALFAAYSAFDSGSYTFNIEADSTGATTVAGEQLDPRAQESVGRAVPRFARSESASAVVAGVGAVAGGTVSGAVYEDANGNGTREPSEEGVDGITVFVDTNGDGAPSAGEPTTVTGLNGLYGLTATADGAVKVRIVTPSGFRRTTADPASDVTVSGGSVVTGPDFGLKSLAGLPTHFAVGAGSGSAAVSFFDQARTKLFEAAPFEGFTGGVRTASADFNADGTPDVVVGTGPGRATRVVVLDGKTRATLFAIDPFEAAFTGGVYVAVGDINGDGIADLVITPDEGGGPRARVFSGAGFPSAVQLADFFGINDPNFRGGARAAIGDITGDRVGDLVVAAGFGGGPRVATFDGAKLSAEGALSDQSVARWEAWKPFGDFLTFEESLRNGAFVTAGDFDGDGFAELAAGGGPGGGPRVSTFDGKALVTGGGAVRDADFFAGDVNNRGGIRLAAKDLDGDDRADLVTGSGIGAGSRVTGYAGSSLAGGGPPELFGFDAIPGFTGGVFVG